MAIRNEPFVVDGVLFFDPGSDGNGPLSGNECLVVDRYFLDRSFAISDRQGGGIANDGKFSSHLRGSFSARFAEIQQ